MPTAAAGLAVWLGRRVALIGELLFILVGDYIRGHPTHAEGVGVDPRAESEFADPEGQ